MTKEAPYVRAAFINDIAEEGTKEEAIEWLQKTWNERCALTAEVERLKAALVRLVADINAGEPRDEGYDLARAALQSTEESGEPR